MYLHIGEDTLVRTKEIIAIIDKESANFSTIIDEFLTHREHEVVNLSKKKYKSIVFTENQIYYSPLAAGTLKKRSRKLSIHEFF